MPSDFTKLDHFIQDWELDARDAMQWLAEDTEEYIRANKTWQDDTGALSASITGYEIRVGNPSKNFNDPDWVHARTGRVLSRYRNLYPENVPAHYFIYTEASPLSDDDPTAIVSSFVEYGGEVENDLRIGGSFSDGLNFMEQNAERVMKKFIKL